MGNRWSSSVSEMVTDCPEASPINIYFKILKINQDTLKKSMSIIRSFPTQDSDSTTCWAKDSLENNGRTGNFNIIRRLFLKPYKCKKDSVYKGPHYLMEPQTPNNKLTPTFIGNPSQPPHFIETKYCKQNFSC